MLARIANRVTNRDYAYTLVSGFPLPRRARHP